MVSRVLKKVFLVDLLIGMSVTLRNQFRPHVTEEYPRETPDLAPRFRGVAGMPSISKGQRHHRD